MRKEKKIIVDENTNNRVNGLHVSKQNITPLKTEHLTFTRFIAALIIVFFHFGVDAPPFNNNFFRPLLVNSGLAVSYFFVLSGFVMVVAYGGGNEHVDAKRYLINRAARILPVYYAAMLLMLLYYYVRIHVLKTPSIYYPNATDTLLNSTLLQSWVPGRALTLNPPAWSLSVEGFFYLAFPFILNKVYRRVKFKSFIAGTVAFFIVSQALFHFLIYTWPNQIYYFYFQPVLRLNEFLVGIATGGLFLQKKMKVRHPFLMLVLLTLTAMAILRIDVWPLDFHNGLFAVFFAPMLYVLAVNEGRLYKVFSKRALTFLGEISYAVYIFQHPVYYLFTATLTYSGHKITPLLFYIYLLLLLIVAAVSHLFIEVPLRKLIRTKRL